MKLRIKLILSVLALFCCSLHVLGQKNSFSFHREIRGINNQWHKLVLPDAIFEKTKTNLSDIRILGVLTNGDTIEAPYILRTTEEATIEQVPFQLINSSVNDRLHYFTFKMKNVVEINYIQLHFKQTNFNATARLEGSMNQHEWFNILSDYRMLGIENAQTRYHFSTLFFPLSSYAYFRIVVNSADKLELSSAQLLQKKEEKGQIAKYAIRETIHRQELAQSIITLKLNQAVPVSFLKLQVSDSFDYYRPISIWCLKDSVKTEKGWHLNYRQIYNGMLSSLEEPLFKFGQQIGSQFKICISNGSNQPLQIDSIGLEGYVHELIVRFTQEGKYYLNYGCQSAQKPEYDITRFMHNIPEQLEPLTLESEKQIQGKEAVIQTPLFSTKGWLWFVMGVVMILLGWFALKIMKE